MDDLAVILKEESAGKRPPMITGNGEWETSQPPMESARISEELPKRAETIWGRRLQGHK